METDLKCNRLTCRGSLVDKAVVTTCSHIFCIECANELFNASRLCPACDTSLLEPDDVVICSLHPTNDYKTSVLSGLSPATILEICSRAISFWQYQAQQENSFQQAMVRNLNDRNAHLQKQLDSIIREANGEITLLSNKMGELERDLELERRKVRDLQDSAREKDKEYQKLKLLHDNMKRKALLAPNTIVHDNAPQQLNDPHLRPRTFITGPGNNVDLGAVVGGMEANGIQRTPIGARKAERTFGPPQQHLDNWRQQPQTYGRPIVYRQPFVTQTEHSYRSTSERSGSADEVEHMLTGRQHTNAGSANRAGWSNGRSTVQRGYVSTTKKSTFQPR